MSDEFMVYGVALINHKPINYKLKKDLPLQNQACAPSSAPG